jgi:Cu-Zn family superoxide dismutase
VLNVARIVYRETHSRRLDTPWDCWPCLSMRTTQPSRVDRHSGDPLPLETYMASTLLTHRLLPTLVALAAVACKGDAGSNDSLRADSAARAAAAAAPARATATIRNATGREIGTVTIAEMGPHLMLEGALSGLPPGTHAIHLHMVGKCESPFESAGEHWNPTNRKHGGENPQGPHLGDLPNLVAAADSTAALVAGTAGGALTGAAGLLDADGAALVIHTAPDDNKTDPAGNSGDRIACGVVVRS